MAVFSAAIPLLLLVLSVSSPSVNGNTAPAVDCSAVLISLAKCLPFVTNGSHVDKPEDACCSGLKTVLDTNAECLCEGLKKSKDMGISLNITKAATLPAACKLNAPPCSLIAKPPASAPVIAKPPTSPPAPVPAAGPVNGPGPGSSTSAPAPTPASSHSNRGSSISVLSLAISGALLILFARV